MTTSPLRLARRFRIKNRIKWMTSAMTMAAARIPAAQRSRRQSIIVTICIFLLRSLRIGEKIPADAVIAVARQTHLGLAGGNAEAQAFFYAAASSRSHFLNL